MKKTCGFFGIIAFAAVIALFTTGCGSPPPPVTAALPDGVTLDQAIAEAAARIDERIPAGSRIALLNFNSPSDRFSLYVLDELSANLLDSGRLTVVDRREMDLIRNEIDFQFSGDVDDDSIQQVGRRLGAQSIVSGTLTEIGGDYRIAIRVLNVESAAIEVHFRSDIANDRRVQALLEGGRTGVAVGAPQRIPAPPAPVAPVPASQAVVAQPTPAVAPVVVAPEPRLENGRRTFDIRPRAYQGARAVTVFVDYIVVRNEYVTIRLRNRSTGRGHTSERILGFLSRTQVVLQDLDRPDRSFVPVQSGFSTTGVNLHYGVWLTFRNVNATRFSLICTTNSPRIVFDEIRIGDPD